MSGLETAIRNALDRSERGDGQVRARIYQSARQALDAGLRKQGVTDNLVIMQQRKRLEDKISEIENEEIDKLAQSAQPPVREAAWPQADIEAPRQAKIDQAPSVDVSLDAPQAAAPGLHPNRGVAPDPVVMVDAPRQAGATPAAADAASLGGVTRSEPQAAQAQPVPFSVDVPHLAERADPGRTEAAPLPGKNKGRERKARRGAKSSLDMPAERAAKPRRRRSFLSHLITWMITLGVVAVGCWIFYQSGMVQSIVDDAIESARRPPALRSSGQGPSALTSRGGFSEEWADIFDPDESTAFRAGPQARAEVATGSEGQALKVISATPGAGGDIAVEVPAEILREIAGKSSTLALTIQSATNQPSQISVRCDFGSLGTCSRHRFIATQEKLDALFRVTFDRSIAPNAPGRLVFNTGIQGADRPVFIYSIRALPGQ
ncbi:hypothetical protein SAMN03159496_01307 [Rhizobium sp. NFR07]|uniref:hypothetical protein n=1 Tax=Rhizobium sp. NFR07 TaxID=1566262 RepID=UPI0008F40AB6|nr:hypothetical protein [Rhizobium sp. NFR07]SFA98012.1 hypothetical protein SAMN03159496_01307 [Rhizobium sp. NFR07]